MTNFKLARENLEFKVNGKSFSIICEHLFCNVNYVIFLLKKIFHVYFY